MKEGGLSASSIETIEQFKRNVHQLKYPTRMRHSSMSVRSLLTFFYDFQPDKVLSLKLSTLYSTDDLDVFVFPMQQYV